MKPVIGNAAFIATKRAVSFCYAAILDYFRPVIDAYAVDEL